MTRVRITVALLFLSGVPALCAELELRYAAIERVIADQVIKKNSVYELTTR